jgi:hypothetical protein
MPLSPRYLARRSALKGTQTAEIETQIEH